MSLPYRRDIDGLRAVAVLFVIGFHYFPGVFPGGFVGVDVFFVISGFLITSLIQQDVAANSFSLVDFYGRRIRRIFPGLVCVLIVCLALGFLFMLPEAYRTLSLNAAASAGFIANIALYLQQDYFAPSAEFNPLLHIWSLGVEEQFYLFWPLVLMLLTRRRSLIVAALGLSVLSFVCNIMQSTHDPVGAFFLPFSRFWELGLGALLALLRINAIDVGRSREWMSWLGLALLAAAMIAIDRDSSFPGWWAILPVAGAALLIAGGEGAKPNRLLLSQPALVYIGLISYPLYLWHWPVLVFARIIRFQKEPTVIMSIGLIALALLLAHATYRLIERPIRTRRHLSAKALSLAGVMAAVACLGGVVYARHGLPDRFPKDVQKLIANTADNEPTMATCVFSIAGPPPALCDGEGPSGAPLTFVWGDSHAYHLIPGLLALQADQKDFRLARSIFFACPPLVDPVATSPVYCNEANAYARHKIEQLKPDTVIIAARWAYYNGVRGYARLDEQEVRKTLAWLKSVGVQHVVVFGQFPYWKLAPSTIPLRALQMSIFNVSAARLPVSSERNATYLDSAAFAAENMVKLASAAEGATFISPSSTLCNDDGCLILVPGSDGEPVSRDDGHLTVAASRFFVRQNAEAIRPGYRQ